MKKGFTLLEILITSLIASIVGLGTIFAISGAQKVTNEYTKQSFIVSNILTVMNMVSKDVKAGALMESADSTSLTIKNVDLTNNVWRFKNSRIFRNDKEIVLPVPSNYEINGSFSTENASKYHSATINISMTIKGGAEITRNNIRNTYYCRTDPDNYIVPTSP